MTEPARGTVIDGGEFLRPVAVLGSGIAEADVLVDVLAGRVARPCPTRWDMVSELSGCVEPPSHRSSIRTGSPLDVRTSAVVATGGGERCPTVSTVG